MSSPRDLPPVDPPRYQPWGRLQKGARNVLAAGPSPDPAADFVSLGSRTALPFGNGRSYGDVCMNGAGVLLGTRGLGELISFDGTSGRVRAGAGVLLSQILQVAVPAGWFLPVTPGTRFVTLGGAIANDVHGKNHHAAGTFGAHVTRLELLRSDGSRIECAPDENRAWFEATVGGLGLTGLITWCELQLIPVAGRSMRVESVRFENLAEFFAVSPGLDQRYDYTVSWVDCLAGGDALGRGWMMAGAHAPPREQRPHKAKRGLNFFLSPPVSLVNRLSLRAFNALYFRRRVPRHAVTDYEPFFYPLDAIRNWNRMYGPRGFYQFQCVVPPADGEAAIRELLSETNRSGEGSFLAVLKRFGDRPSPGLLSFPRPGPTLALDFPNRGKSTLRLLRRLEAITMEAGGALYPAKDACMTPETFARSYPEWEKLEAVRDPAVTSDFWTRVTAPFR